MAAIDIQGTWKVDISVRVDLTELEARAFKAWVYRNLTPVNTAPMTIEEKMGETIAGDMNNKLNQLLGKIPT